MKILRTILALGWLFITAVHLQAAIHYVDAGSANPVSPYLSWSTAAGTIQDAVDAASQDDEVLVTNGVYATGGRAIFGTLTNRVAIYKPLTLRSLNGPEFTIIQGRQVPGTVIGDGAIRCVYLTSGANLFGFTLTNGATRNTGDFFDLDGDGGGFLALWDSPIIVSNCVIAGNSAASQGGGAYTTGGKIIRCTFSGNSAMYGGGGLYSAGDRAVLNDCIISGNFANYAGGVLGAGMTNCLIVGNVATNSGGGAYESWLNNCTVLKNSARIGGGLYKSLDSYTPCVVYNSIVYDNTSSDPLCGSNYLNCTIGNSCTAPMPSSGQGNITNDPAFIAPASANFRLQSNSICINSGNNIYVNSLTDLDGNSRIASGIVDMGAYEFQGPAPPRGTHHVNLNNPTPIAPYISWATAATNIQDAIDIALPGGEVVVSNGVYATGGHGAPGSVTNRVEANKPVTIRSVNGPAVTRIEGWQVPGTTNGNGAIRCAFLTSSASLSGFTLTNGATRVGDSGGGLLCDSTVLVSNCVIINNSAGYGGGIYGGRLRDCLLIGNTAHEGGEAVRGTLVDCLVSKNRAAFSGGGASGCNLTNCALSGNLGGASSAAYSGVLTGCKITGNSGAVAIEGRQLESSLVAFNDGGGISGSWNVHQPWPVPVRNCTVISNAPWGTKWCLVTNSIVIFNGSGDTNNNNENYFFWYCCTRPLPTSGFGCITDDPLFVDSANGDFRLQSNSSCINAGDNFVVGTSTDLDANPRIVGGAVDMGAYEFQGPNGTNGFGQWLAQYGFPTNGTADYIDPDYDGLNNWQEWRAGTNPTNAASGLRLSSASPANGAVTLNWQSVLGVGYYVQRSMSLNSPAVFTTIATNIPGQTGTTSFSDTNVPPTTQLYYRVGVQ